MGSLLLIASLTLAGLGVLVWYAVAAPASQWLGRTLVRDARPSANRVALTFDDGPGEATPLVLDLLKEAGIGATFFLCGQNVERYPEYARRIAEEGHEIGNHTHTHPRLFWKTPGKIAWEIRQAQQVIAHCTGRPPQLFRPPYGLRWFGLFPVLSQNGLRAVMWSVNSLDWKLPASAIASRVLRGAAPGAIILLHDGVPPRESGNRQPTAEALREILQSLKGQYQFATISEMFGEG